MKTITIRQKTKAEGFDVHCSAMHELPYAEYTVTHYGMTFDDLADGAEDPGRKNKSSGN